MRSRLLDINPIPKTISLKVEQEEEVKVEDFEEAKIEEQPEQVEEITD